MHHPLACTCLAAACLLAACGGGADAVPAPPSEHPAADAVSDEIAIKLHDAADLPAVLGAYGLVQLDQFGRRPIYRVRAPQGADLEDLAERLQADVRVRYAEPNYLLAAPEDQRRRPWTIGGDDKSFATQWSTAVLRLAEAHAVSTGAGVTVAVLDTGIDASHPAFAGRLVAGFDFVDLDPDPREEGSPGDPAYGHGTHVASLVAQVAPGARIMPLRVLDRDGVGNAWVLAEALAYAIDPDGDPATDDGAHVVNLSMGTPARTELLDDLIDVATCEPGSLGDDDPDDVERCLAGGGVVVVIAAGNSGDATPYYPAAEEAEGSIAIAASDEAGALASFSTRGDWVALAAPGDKIQGAVPGGGWAVWSGTSMAAPMVAGAAALLVAARPHWEADEVVEQLGADALALCGSSVARIDPAKTLTGRSAPAQPCPR